MYSLSVLTLPAFLAEDTSLSATPSPLAMFHVRLVLKKMQPVYDWQGGRGITSNQEKTLQLTYCY